MKKSSTHIKALQMLHNLHTKGIDDARGLTQH